MTEGKSTTVGTCAICDREIAVRTDEAGVHLVHHGYQRPGDGHIQGDCFAVGCAPHEVAPHAAEMWRRNCVAWRRDALSYLARLRSGGVHELHRPLKVPVPTTALRPDPRYYFASREKDPGWIEWPEPFVYNETELARQAVFRELVAAEIRSTEFRARHYEREIERMDRCLKDWTAKPLRERPKVEPNPTGRRRRRRVFGMGGAG